MKKALEVLGIFIIVLLIVAGALFSAFKVGVMYGEQTIVYKPDTITMVRVDTVIHEKVIPKKIVVDRIVYDTLFSRDSVLVAVNVPISRYTYSDSSYRAEISGYRVSLDRMETYNREVNKTITNTVIKRVPKRWGIGISAGYSFTPQGFQPYVGVGVNYNVISF